MLTNITKGRKATFILVVGILRLNLFSTKAARMSNPSTSAEWPDDMSAGVPSSATLTVDEITDLDVEFAESIPRVPSRTTTLAVSADDLLWGFKPNRPRSSPQHYCCYPGYSEPMLLCPLTLVDSGYTSRMLRRRVPAEDVHRREFTRREYVYRATLPCLC